MTKKVVSYSMTVGCLTASGVRADNTEWTVPGPIDLTEPVLRGEGDSEISPASVFDTWMQNNGYMELIDAAADEIATSPGESVLKRQTIISNIEGSAFLDSDDRKSPTIQVTMQFEISGQPEAMVPTKLN